MRVKGLMFEVSGLGFRFYDLELRVPDSEFQGQGLGKTFMVKDLGFTVYS